jgi:hypothetical protein
MSHETLKIVILVALSFTTIVMVAAFVGCLINPKVVRKLFGMPDSYTKFESDILLSVICLALFWGISIWRGLFR